MRSPHATFPGTKSPESGVTKAPEYCHPPIVNTVHPEPVTVTEKVSELLERVLRGSPTLLPPKRENKDEERGILLGCEEVIWVRPPCIEEPRRNYNDDLRRLHLKYEDAWHELGHRDP